MRIFIYEFVTGGGWWRIDAKIPPSGSLAREGAAMLRAIVADFSRFTNVVTTVDSRLRSVDCVVESATVERHICQSVRQESELFTRLSGSCDWTLVIAPETDGHLLRYCSLAQETGGRLLSPGPEFVALAASKDATALRLEQAGVRVPRGYMWTGQESGSGERNLRLTFPLVVKPHDGAGSVGVSLVQSWDEVAAAVQPNFKYRIESYQPGRAASVAVLAGPKGSVVLPASSQILSDDGRFQYLGGVVPLAANDMARSTRLADSVVRAMPSTIGYFGIDLVLGETADGSEDAVIEVNPRLTTSYLGLRRLANGNLAQAMFEVATGGHCELSFKSEAVQFAADSNEVV